MSSKTTATQLWQIFGLQCTSIPGNLGWKLEEQMGLEFYFHTISVSLQTSCKNSVRIQAGTEEMTGEERWNGCCPSPARVCPREISIGKQYGQEFARSHDFRTDVTDIRVSFNFICDWKIMLENFHNTSLKSIALKYMFYITHLEIQTGYPENN